jgi:predicted nucleic acid-binding Zn ribbon protein
VDPYRTLKTMPSATAEDIDAAYARERARLEENATGEPQDNERHDALEAAYALLRDPERRAALDQHILRVPAVSMVEPSVEEDDRREPSPVAGPAAAGPAHALAPLTVSNPAPSASIAQRLCPHCGAPNPGQAVTCAACGRQMTRPCPNCGQPVALGQIVCERCQTHVVEYDQRRYADALVVGQHIRQERDEMAANVGALEASNDQRNRHAVLFWLIALALAVAVIVVLVLANQPHP